MFRPDSFTAKAFFDQHPEAEGLIVRWSDIFDQWEGQVGSVDNVDEATFEETKAEVTGEARELIHEHHFPKIDPDAQVPGLIATYAGLWSTRAMLAASDIRRQMAKLEPGDFQL